MDEGQISSDGLKVKTELEKYLEKCENKQYNVKLTYRCPYCGDSGKKYKGHFVVNIDEEIITCKCFKCGIYLHVNSLLEYIESPLRIKEIQGRAFKRNQDFTTKKVKEAASGALALQYAEERYGVKMPQELKTFIEARGIDNILEFVDKNDINISLATRDTLARGKFVGYITDKNRRIICRNLNSKSEIRYININVEAKTDMFSFQISKENLFLKRKPIRVIICEGFFDMIGILLCRKHFLNYDIVVCANSMSNIEAVLSYVSSMLINYIVVMYASDSDVLQKVRNNVKVLKCHPFIKEIKVCYNANAKDFGEDIRNINPRIYRG